MSNVIFLINLPMCNLIAMGEGGVFKTYPNHIPVSLLEHVTGTSSMSNVNFLINLPVYTLIAIGEGGCI